MSATVNRVRRPYDCLYRIENLKMQMKVEKELVAAFNIPVRGLGSNTEKDCGAYLVSVATIIVFETMNMSLNRKQFE